MATLNACLHIPTPSSLPSPSPSNFTIAPMVTGRLTGRMGLVPILPVGRPITISTLLNFDGDGDRIGDGVGMCKQAFNQKRFNIVQKRHVWKIFKVQKGHWSIKFVRIVKLDQEISILALFGIFSCMFTSFYNFSANLFQPHFAGHTLFQKFDLFKISYFWKFYPIHTYLYNIKEIFASQIPYTVTDSYAVVTAEYPRRW